HYDRWVVPPGAVEIARTPAASQAFVVGRSLAVQFHPELDAVGLQGWLDWGGASKVRYEGLDPDVMMAQTIATAEAARARTWALVDAFLATVAGLLPH
ncbi:MAG: aminotransferase, partial [Microbacteriaceae bacterium]|nr:aminotransferase [Microbacteriaceae bacterium]